MKKIRYAYGFFFFLIILTVFIASSTRIKDERKILTARYALNIVSVPPVALRLIAGEFNGIISDFILLQIGSFIGSGKKIEKDEWENVFLGFDQVMELDPYFEQTYLQAQSAMAWDARKPEKAIRLLDISRKSRFWDFRPGFYMGFDYYYFFNDYENASNIFLETAKVKNAPVLVALLGSRFSSKHGRAQASLMILENMLDEPDITDENVKEINNRINALKGVIIIENAVKAYFDKFGTKPDTLDRLIETGVLVNLPPNPYALPYTYDAKTNQVRFDDVGDLKKE